MKRHSLACAEIPPPAGFKPGSDLLSEMPNAKPYKHWNASNAEAHRCLDYVPWSVSLATTLDAPTSFAAMADAPHPVPTSKTVSPRNTSGLSRIYLQGMKAGIDK